eukprot:gnl/MRDRNA2_/MRDRNA2_81894_c0_seq1.p1 gnl/MRDRNA2_/MRDRNA2_81894_c0~~gnl/MRDRNA2_/MRDRNA2_81894_c0_seq1.p1  ORF type:complete len:807 (-),score=150.72 gnl/MRDRNA2_/MRDRNA2_81894_c0_seq1:239-2368(-)
MSDPKSRIFQDEKDENPFRITSTSPFFMKSEDHQEARRSSRAAKGRRERETKDNDKESFRKREAEEGRAQFLKKKAKKAQKEAFYQMTKSENMDKNDKRAKNEAETKRQIVRRKKSLETDTKVQVAAEKQRKGKESAPHSEKQDEESEKAMGRLKKAKELDTNARSIKLLGPRAYRKMHRIIVNSGCPPPYENFNQTKSFFGKTLYKALEKQKYVAPTPIQAQAWPIVFKGQDIVAVAETGSGKTLAFLLPALVRIGERGGIQLQTVNRRRVSALPSEQEEKQKKGKSSQKSWSQALPSVLILGPTRELVLQIAAEAKKFASVVSKAKARVVTIYGGVAKDKQLKQIDHGADILISTPGRLLDFLEGLPDQNVAAPVSVKLVTYLVLDEADRMLDMGFEKDVTAIISQCPETGDPSEAGGAQSLRGNAMRQTLFFTATWPQAVRAIAAKFTSEKAIHVRIGQGESGDQLRPCSSVTQEVFVLKVSQKQWKLCEILKAQLGHREAAIVFVGTKHTCSDLEQMVKYWFPAYWCRAIHSKVDQEERLKILNEFRAVTKGTATTPKQTKKGTTLTKGQTRGILLATDVASRGLDIPGVTLIINYDFGGGNIQGGVQGYVHRIGRTGRAGKTGHAVTFFTKEDKEGPEFVKLLQESGQAVPKELVKMANEEDSSRDPRREKDNKRKYKERASKPGYNEQHQKRKRLRQRQKEKR